MGFPRQELWSGFPFPSPRDLPHPGIKPRSPALQVDSLPAQLPGNSWGARNLNWSRFQAQVSRRKGRGRPRSPAGPPQSRWGSLWPLLPSGWRGSWQWRRQSPCGLGSCEASRVGVGSSLRRRSGRFWSQRRLSPWTGQASWEPGPTESISNAAGLRPWGPLGCVPGKMSVPFASSKQMWSCEPLTSLSG